MNLSTIKLLYGIFTGVAAIASVIFLLLPTTKNDLKQKEASEPSNLDIMKLTTKLFFTKKSILISIGSAHSGILLCFWSGIFPTAVAFTQKLGDGFEKSTIIALTVLFTGLGQLSGGIILTILNLKFQSCKREIIVTTSTICQLIAYSIVFFTFPAIASLDKTDEIGFISPR
uniref:UNC93-like protein MFSD11 n=1 Tax=Acrobeloides nanus TaxID=290746 RepID=A0A914C6Z4_9BILA